MYIDNINIQYNAVTLEDSMFQLGQYESHHFYNFQSTMRQKAFDTSFQNKDIIYKTSMMLSEIAVSHSRQIYDIIDLLGDLGGVMEVLLFVFGFIFFPFSEHNYIIRALQKLYMARTTNDKIFKRRRIDTKEFNLSKKDHGEIKSHKAIKLSSVKFLKLYFNRLFSVFVDNQFWNCLSKEQRKLMKLVDKGQALIEESLDIVNLIRNLREL